MNDGECFIYYSDSIIYAFPDLVCSEGGSIPSFNSTTREKYILRPDGRVNLSVRDSIQANYLTDSYITHVYKNQYLGNISDFFLPATIFIALFLIAIYRWFFRLRG